MFVQYNMEAEHDLEMQDAFPICLCRCCCISCDPRVALTLILLFVSVDCSCRVSRAGYTDALSLCTSNEESTFALDCLQSG